MDYRLRRSWALIASTSLALLAARAASSADSPAPTLFGFEPDEVAAQQALEQRFDAQLKTSELRDWLKTLSSEPNQVGSPHNKANAEAVRDLFKQWGWDAQIETFEVLYPTLKRHTLEMVAPKKFVASLKEPPVAGDASSARTANAMPPYNAYGADGDVTAELVYLNYG